MVNLAEQTPLLQVVENRALVRFQVESPTYLLYIHLGSFRVGQNRFTELGVSYMVLVSEILPYLPDLTATNTILWY